MSASSISIELPPEGLLIRELATTAINAIAYLGNVSVSVKGNVVALESQDIVYSLTKAAKGFENILRVKRELEWPPLHPNDKGTLKKSSVVGGKSLDTYLDLVELFIPQIPNLPKGRLSVALRANKVVLGRGNMALPQALRIEFYESSLKYNEPYMRKIEIRVDDSWLSLLMAAYVGAPTRLGPYELMTTPEVFSENPSLFKHFIGVNLVHVIRRVRMRPTLPYIFQVHILTRYPPKEILERYVQFLGESKTAADTELLEGMRPLSFRVHVLSLYGGKEYVELSREDLVLSTQLFRFLDKMGSTCAQQLSNFIEMAYEARNPKVLNAVTYLYEAIHNAKDPAFAAYYLMRVAADIKSERGYSPLTSNCAERIVEALLP